MSDAADGLHAVARFLSRVVALILLLGGPDRRIWCSFLGGPDRRIWCNLRFDEPGRPQTSPPYVAHCQLAEESSIGVTHDTCDPMDSSDFVSENKKPCHQ